MWSFRFAFRLQTNIPQLPPLAIFFPSASIPKYRACPAEARQAGEIRGPCQCLGLETPQPRGESDASIPDHFRTDRPEGRILEKPLGVVEADFREGLAALLEKRKAQWRK
jgi:hypothetical protein